MLRQKPLSFADSTLLSFGSFYHPPSEKHGVEVELLALDFEPQRKGRSVVNSKAGKVTIDCELLLRPFRQKGLQLRQLSHAIAVCTPCRELVNLGAEAE